ncbi:MAG: hypothetical protein GX610_07260 [Rhodococcus sp.]|nr:hypothetical protein [Rhodococcus sp. (in: high G+C Gram-positive bacteria)]
MPEPAASTSPALNSPSLKFLAGARSRPRTVDVAFWVWALAAVLLILLGLIAVTTPAAGLREQLTGYAALDTAVLAVRISGGLAVLAGFGIGFTLSAVREGSSRARGVATAISVAYSTIQVVLVFVGLNTVFAMTVPLLLLVASVLVFRPEGHVWFVR